MSEVKRGIFASRKSAAVTGVMAAVAGLSLFALSQREDMSVPPGTPEVAGATLMRTKKCIRCHRIAGEGGLVGPDLTAVSVKLPKIRVREILIDPRGVDPNAKMPAPKISAPQREALLAYLRTLDGGEGARPPSALSPASSPR